MGARFFGEFMGTAVLILLGDGVVADVLLKRSKAEGSGWLAIAAGWAFAVVFGVFIAIACGSPDAYINPAFTLGMAISSGDFSKFLPFPRGTDPWCNPSSSCLATLFAALASNRRSEFEIGLLFDNACDP